MVSLEIPHALRGEITGILQALKAAWPHCKTMCCAKSDTTTDNHANIDRYVGSVQWLTDRGLITFEALTVDNRGITLMDAILTTRGHHYAQTSQSALS